MFIITRYTGNWKGSVLGGGGMLINKDADEVHKNKVPLTKTPHSPTSTHPANDPNQNVR